MATTPFVFNVPVVRGISVAYGGNCSATAFFFNETDALSDPDSDGNWNKAKPRPLRNLGGTALLDYNTAGVTNPSTYPIAYYRGDLGGAPTTGPASGTEIDTNTYTAISTDDADINVLKVATVTMVASIQTVFRINTDGPHVKDMNFTFIGESINGTNCQNGTGTKKTIPISFLNPTTNNWDIMLTIPGSGAVTGEKDAQYGEIIFSPGDVNIEKYVASDRTVSVMISSAAAGGQAACLLTDRVKLVTTEYPLNTDFCQSSTLAPITVTNNGNQDVNVDINLLTAFSGTDINLALKEWMGTGDGCGSDGNGMGGWEDVCSAAVTSAPTSSTCTVFTSANATTNHRVATKLLQGDSNQLCFSGETWTASLGTTFAGTGDYNHTAQTGANP